MQSHIFIRSLWDSTNFIRIFIFCTIWIREQIKNLKLEAIDSKNFVERKKTFFLLQSHTSAGLIHPNIRLKRMYSKTCNSIPFYWEGKNWSFIAFSFYRVQVWSKLIKDLSFLRGQGLQLFLPPGPLYF